MASLSRPKILAGSYIVEFEDIKIVKHMEPKHIDRIVVTPCFTMLNILPRVEYIGEGRK